jgi:hypothetical protein
MRFFASHPAAHSLDGGFLQKIAQFLVQFLLCPAFAEQAAQPSG